MPWANRRAVRRWWVCAGLAAVASAPAPARAEEILVFAAASLTDALEAIGRSWQASTGNTVLFNFGGSSDLGRQLRAGVPADVFLSADPEQMDLVERAGLVRGDERLELLSNALVVVVPPASSLTVRAAGDLAGVKRLALADPEAVPAGVYARRWLEATGVWARVREHVIPTLNVRAALAAVESENAEAAIVYRTDAARSRRARVAYEVPRADTPPIVYVVAPRAGTPKAAARAFVAHLRSPAARAEFEKQGFLALGR
jgi:molybdate transport system substrate-binding protein